MCVVGTQSLEGEMRERWVTAGGKEKREQEQNRELCILILCKDADTAMEKRLSTSHPPQETMAKS